MYYNSYIVLLLRVLRPSYWGLDVVLPSPVLIVDDDPFVREVITAALAGAGVMAVSSCSSGEDALAVIATVHPALILMDFMLPAMDGAATWEAIRRNLGPPLPGVVFLTARREGVPAAPGVLGAISKPFNPATLVTELERICGTVSAISPIGGDRLAGVRAEFVRTLPAAAAVIDSNRQELAAGWRREAATALLAKAHTLAGSAGLFGRHALGTAAGDVEGLLLKFLKLDCPPDSQDMRALQQAAAALAAACHVE